MLADSITSLVTDTITLQRRVKGTKVDGKYVPASPTTFTADVVMQPAFGLNRVVGGADMRGTVDNRQTTEVLDFFTLTEVKTVSKTHDADIVLGFRGGDWTVMRVEAWSLLDGIGGLYYKVLISKQTKGAA